jgi:dihydroflavonol-4-reductase
MACPPPGPVCVTGASGFIAAHLVEQLLAAGYEVRGTVRGAPDADRYGYLRDLPGAAERLTLLTADLLEPGAFDEAVDGCVGVLHTASPYVVHANDPQRDLVDPALQGTRNVLESVAEAGSVQRVVLTSSLAAISDEPDPDHVFTEDDWNEQSTLTRNPYYLSKALAEKEAWRLAESQDRYRLVVVNPYMTIGPSHGPSMNTSNGVLKSILEGDYPGILALSWGFVDVRDIAAAHVEALRRDDAEGRHICASEVVSMREVVSILREAGYGEGYSLPSLDLSGAVGTGLVRLFSYTQPAGVGSYLRTHLGRDMRWSNARAKERLGIDFRPAKASILDAVADMERHGHLSRG